MSHVQRTIILTKSNISCRPITGLHSFLCNSRNELKITIQKLQNWLKFTTSIWSATAQWRLYSHSNNFSVDVCGRIRGCRQCTVRTDRKVLWSYDQETVLFWSCRLTLLAYYSKMNACNDMAVAQCLNVGLWPANFPCPTLDLQLTGDHLCG